MNPAIGDLAGIVRNPTAHEAAGATIARGTDIGIPPNDRVRKHDVITDGWGNHNSQINFPSRLESSHRTRPSHIPTSRRVSFLIKNDGERTRS